MTPLKKLRIYLSLGALVGLVPVTWSFMVGLPFLIILLFSAPGIAIPIVIISAYGLRGCWKAFAEAMAEKPAPHADPRVVTAVVVALIWGLILNSGVLAMILSDGSLGWVETAILIFPMPGITGLVMLKVARRRARRQAGEASTAHEALRDA
ncbi:hypothetical protein [Pseudomonas sp. UBA6562]|uniref:hypothetical protein n=1 Tax=Pseudomonas sp. UBA6562 TaxID=1947332 RepID=UPI0025D413A3|nr:hypothetical protein [Pseudomonas sp. UBA6562]